MNYFNLILSNQSILRNLQFQALSKTNLFGEVIEFGANDIIDRNFANLNKDKCNITYSNIKTKNKNFIKIDLQKKFKIKKKYDFVIIFNDKIDKLKVQVKRVARRHITVGQHYEAVSKTSFDSI